MFQHRLFAELAQRLLEYSGVLFNDASERNHVDDAAQTVTDGMVQREGQRSQRFATAGRHRQ